jgi:hypothetical protein
MRSLSGWSIMNPPVRMSCGEYFGMLPASELTKSNSEGFFSW